MLVESFLQEPGFFWEPTDGNNWVLTVLSRSSWIFAAFSMSESVFGDPKSHTSWLNCFCTVFGAILTMIRGIPGHFTMYMSCSIFTYSFKDRNRHITQYNQRSFVQLDLEKTTPTASFRIVPGHAFAVPVCSSRSVGLPSSGDQRPNLEEALAREGLGEGAGEETWSAASFPGAKKRGNYSQCSGQLRSGQLRSGQLHRRRREWRHSTAGRNDCYCWRGICG